MADDQQFDNMLSDAQQTVRTFNRPYAMIGNGIQAPHLPGFLSHIPFIGDKLAGAGPSSDMMGRINGGLDNALLAAALTPGPHGPEGAGEGISRALQGVLGAGQFQRQRAMQNSMMPYQMIMPRLQAEDEMAQINQRTQEAAYYRKHGDYLDGMLDVRNNPKTVQGTHTDDKGQEWQEIFNPIEGKSRLFNPTSQKHADELPPDQQPTFKNSQKQANRATPGGLQGEIMEGLMSADPGVNLRAQQQQKIYQDMNSNRAYDNGYQGARGRDAAPDTKGKTKEFIQNERAGILKDLPAIKPIPLMEQLSSMPGAETDPDIKAYKAKQQAGLSAITERQRQFDRWSQSDAPSKGLGFHDWYDQQQKSGNTGGSAPSPSTPSASTPWRPS